MTVEELKTRILQVKSGIVKMVQDGDLSAEEAQVIFPLVLDFVLKNEYLER